jgi:hypothetical protein
LNLKLAYVAAIRKKSLHETPCFAVLLVLPEDEKSDWFKIKYLLIYVKIIVD